ncbi:DUF4932 domain-containing protein [Bernardetia sp.]|uniref:DUF4932 domain-containing protein n=1 Tax=Bernardetia sp. TaxID=1937974 RepID=UPI0025BA0FDF|nr:DUF4932 domain-containing protein [Bernardetia sp.]
MHKLTLVFICLLLFSCNKEKNTHSIKEQKTVEIDINKTIETFMILRSISDDDPLFQYRDSTYKGKPIMYEARKVFLDYKNHPAIEETQKLLKATSSTGDLILQGLLYFEELPSTNQKFEIDSKFWQTKEDTLANYISVINKFYKEAKVEEFINNNKNFYDNAKIEAKSYLDDNLIPTMEEYFGIQNYAYKMLLIPNSPFGMGFGASVKSDKGNIFYQIISPANDIEWNKNSTYATYGFSGKGANEYYRDMVVHEFCHPFVTPYLESDKMKSEIAKTDSLFIPKLDSIMSKQGYGSWWGFVNEHLVRLGEIRIAKAMKTQDLDAMRKTNINENGFILLPEAEELILKYENNRDKYATFQDFIPILINQLETFNKQQIDNKLQQLKKDIKQ